MKNITLRLMTLCAIAYGISSVAVLANPTCPPVVPACLDVYGNVGSPVWVCCKELPNGDGTTTCYDYYKQKQLCDNPPEQPAAYGYTITSTPLFNGNCTGGQGACY